MVGKTLGHYEILEPLGAGGMGEVYRARDTKLDRDVAIKVLPEDFASDQDRLARFEREAKLLASLNHANIAAIYGLEDEGDQRFIAMELVEGETLAQRLARSGRIEVDEALDIARQIAEALEAAHDEGIIHRDVKPANVLLTARGVVKVLDFGIAKGAVLEGGVAATAQATNLTMDGTLMGTPPYMSPEQVRGTGTDKRADIWAFGCVLYEMLAGRGAFTRETVADTLAAILDSEPDGGALPSSTPPAVGALVKRCLRKDPDRRLHDIADARIEIEEALDDPLGEPAKVAPAATPRLLLGVVGGAAMGAVAVWLALGLFGENRGGPPTRATPLQYMLPVEQTLWRPAYTNTLAISADGSIMFYPATIEGADAAQLLWHMVDGSGDGVVPDSERAVSPFLSPDGEWLGFISGEEVFKWKIGSLRAESIGTVPGARRAAWGPTGTIVVGTDSGGLQTISEDGREAAAPLTVLNAERGEFGHRNPSFLPDGRVLFNIHDKANMSLMSIAVTSLDDGAVDILDIQGANPRFVPSGHLLFNRIPDIWAVAFDPDTVSQQGSPIAVLTDVSQAAGRPNAKFDVSDSGTVVYQPLRGAGQGELVWVDRDSDPDPVGISTRISGSPRISPDGLSIAWVNNSSLGIWDGGRIHELDAGGSIPRFAWASNEAVYYAAYRYDVSGVSSHIYTQGVTTEDSVFVRASAPGEGEWKTGSNLNPMDLSTAGRWLLFHTRTDREGSDRFDDIWVVPTSDPSASRLLVEELGSEITWARFSSNDKWIAYAHSGGVWTTLFPDGAPTRVSGEAGGGCPLISAAGDHIYYRSGNSVMSVAVSPETGAALQLPEELLVLADDLAGCNWDIHPREDRFVMSRVVDRPPPANHLEVILNWFEELKELVPTGR